MMKKTVTILILMYTLISLSYTQIFTNTYHAEKKIPVLKTERFMIFNPEQSWNYVHHPSIAYFKGCFYAIFSNGISGEDDPCQRVMITQSTNLKSWSKPVVLQAPEKGDYGVKKVLTPGGITQIDNKLVVFFTENDMDGKSYKRYNPMLYAVTSDNGKDWSEPVSLGISVFPCHRPSVLSSGRLLLTGNRAFYFTDNQTGLSGWQRSSTKDIPDTEGNIAFSQINPTLCEGAIIQHTNGLIYTLFRSTGKTFDGYLWQASSKDNGLNWTEPIHTNFTDGNSKSHFGILPDGRYYYVGTPDTLSVGERSPLVLSVSNDGIKFDRHFIVAKDYYEIKYKGKWKNGQFGYPYTIIQGEYLYIIVTRQKERLELYRIALSQLT